MTVDKYENLYEQLKKLFENIKDIEILNGIIQQIFDKAVFEPHFCTMYAELCEDLASLPIEFDNPNDPSKKQTFRRLLITKCQETFEKQDLTVIPENIDPAEKEEIEAKYKFKKLGSKLYFNSIFFY